jgi:vitamin-K-epoxide reductase (warfarin-sensitive)
MCSPVRPSARRLFLIVAVLAIVGMALSSVSLAHHYSTSKSSFCDLSETVNCDIVNRSEYSTLLGVPVALIGIAGYLALFIVASFYRRQLQAPRLLFWGSVIGLGFALYLTYIEGFVLSTWCILCLSSLVTIFAIFVVSFVLLAVLKRKGAPTI